MNRRTRMGRAFEITAVLAAISGALLCLLAYRRKFLAGLRSARGGATDVPPAPLGPGHWLDSDDPDGGAARERSRRRRHID